MPSWITLPDGYTFALENTNQVGFDGNQLLITFANDVPKTFAANTIIGGQVYTKALYAQIRALMATPVALTNLCDKVATILTGVSLSQPDITLATGFVTGYGFSPDMTYVLHYENLATPDNNGYFSNCTYVSPTQLSFVYGGPGDGILAGDPIIVYIADQNNLQSNQLQAINPTGTELVIQNILL